MPTTETPEPRTAAFLAGLGFAPVGVLPMPVSTAFAWFMLHPPADRKTLVRAFLTTDDATGR
ncbi:hypothetical protein [Actinoplanes friuliensis]|jgi:hypothetical protein|uniref:hypothetical protein n=1 Tax=Actinoplanes friuliensis TaxID=196914 RepID=UPI0011DD9482|nr:hypothetical protein [Actinoplanes friuliensis]